MVTILDSQMVEVFWGSLMLTTPRYIYMFTYYSPCHPDSPLGPECWDQSCWRWPAHQIYIAPDTQYATGCHICNTVQRHEHMNKNVRIGVRVSKAWIISYTEAIPTHILACGVSHSKSLTHRHSWWREHKPRKDVCTWRSDVMHMEEWCNLCTWRSDVKMVQVYTSDSVSMLN